MRISNLSILLFVTAVAGVGALYFFDVFQFGQDQAPLVDANERRPVAAAAHVQTSDTNTIHIAAETHAHVQESAPIEVAPLQSVDEEKAPAQKKVVTPSSAPIAQEKPNKKNQSSVKIAPQKSEAKNEEAKSTMKTLPIEDNFKVKQHKIPGTLGYKHWTGWYYPTKFILTINESPVIVFDGKEFTRPTKELTFDASQPLKAHFVWEFLHGRKAGWRSTDFQLSPDAQSIFIGFDWKDPWQVIIDQAAPIAQSDKSSDNRSVEKR